MLRLSLLLCVGICILPSARSSIPDRCPAKDIIDPCTCKPNYDGACVITCNAVSYNDLVNLAGVHNLCGGHVHFTLVHTRIPGLPSSLWNKLLSSKTVDVSLLYSTVDHLIPLSEPPLTLVSTPGEAAIKINHCTDASGWQWSQLSNFQPYGDFTLVIDDTLLTELSTDFTLIAGGQVTKITIDRNQLKYIPDKIFAPFSYITSLSIQNNNLTEVKRSMFPVPSSRLQYLHLNGNFLTSLPEDLFTDMPSLQVVYMRENKLTTLPENLFYRISSKIIRLDFVHNPWVCDCQLMRSFGDFSGNLELGTCDSPEKMANREVKDVQKILQC